MTVPYFITNESPDCPAWATVKEDGEVMACHATKDDAVAQMVALSLDEDIEPGGELRITGEIPGLFVDHAGCGNWARGCLCGWVSVHRIWVMGDL